jgi:hypothetical protein
MPPYTSRHASQSLRREPAPATRFTREQFASGDGELAACASDLGWRAGVWPTAITVDGVLYRRGRECIDRREGELLSVTYDPAVAGHPSLTLFND